MMPSFLLLWFVATLCAQNATVSAHDAWVRVPAPSKKETAVYMVLENGGSRDQAVVFASSEMAEKVEIHEMKMLKTGSTSDSTMMVMTPATQITIPGKGKTTVGPNGIHLMLFGLKSNLAAGDKVTVTLKLDDGTAVPVTATVRN